MLEFSLKISKLGALAAGHQRHADAAQNSGVQIADNQGDQEWLDSS